MPKDRSSLVEKVPVTQVTLIDQLPLLTAPQCKSSCRSLGPASCLLSPTDTSWSWPFLAPPLQLFKYFLVTLSPFSPGTQFTFRSLIWMETNNSECPVLLCNEWHLLLSTCHIDSRIPLSSLGGAESCLANSIQHRAQKVHPLGWHVLAWQSSLRSSR